MSDVEMFSSEDFDEHRFICKIYTPKEFEEALNSSEIVGKKRPFDISYVSVILVYLDKKRIPVNTAKKFHVLLGTISSTLLCTGLVFDSILLDPWMISNKSAPFILPKLFSCVNEIWYDTIFLNEKIIIELLVTLKVRFIKDVSPVYNVKTGYVIVERGNKQSVNVLKDAILFRQSQYINLKKPSRFVMSKRVLDKIHECLSKDMEYAGTFEIYKFELTNVGICYYLALVASEIVTGVHDRVYKLDNNLAFHTHPLYMYKVRNAQFAPPSIQDVRSFLSVVSTSRNSVLIGNVSYQFVFGKEGVYLLGLKREHLHANLDSWITKDVSDLYQSPENYIRYISVSFPVLQARFYPYPKRGDLKILFDETFPLLVRPEKKIII